MSGRFITRPPVDGNFRPKSAAILIIGFYSLCLIPAFNFAISPKAIAQPCRLSAHKCAQIARRYCCHMSATNAFRMQPVICGSSSSKGAKNERYAKRLNVQMLENVPCVIM